jgi:hypothetical protein
MQYRSLKVSEDTFPDLARALWVAGTLNDRDGNTPPTAQARQAEAFGRIVREWSQEALPGFDAPGFEELCQADWRCQCGRTGIGDGLLTVAFGRAWCRDCLPTDVPYTSKRGG